MTDAEILEAMLELHDGGKPLPFLLEVSVLPLTLIAIIIGFTIKDYFDVLRQKETGYSPQKDIQELKQFITQDRPLLPRKNYIERMLHKYSDIIYFSRQNGAPSFMVGNHSFVNIDQAVKVAQMKAFL